MTTPSSTIRKKEEEEEVEVNRPASLVTYFNLKDITKFVEGFCYLRAPRAFLLEPKKCEPFKRFYVEDINLQKFLFFPDEVPKRNNKGQTALYEFDTYLTNSRQLNFSCFLSFCERYEIRLTGINGLFMTGKYSLGVTFKHVHHSTTPLCLPAYLFEFAYLFCRLCQVISINGMPIDQSQFSSGKDFVTHLEPFVSELPAYVKDTLSIFKDEKYTRKVKVIQTSSPAKYADFIKQSDLYDRTFEAQVTFDPLQLGWILFLLKFNLEVVLNHSPLEPWTECLELLVNRKTSDFVANEEAPAVGEFRQDKDSIGFANLTRTDLSLLFAPDQFLTNLQKKGKSSLQLPLSFVVVPEKTYSQPLPCVELANETLSIVAPCYGIYVPHELREHNESIESYLVRKLRRVNLESLRSASLRSFLQSKGEDAEWKEQLAIDWPTAKMLSIDCVTMLERSPFPFLILRSKDEPLVPTTQNSAFFLYNAIEKTLDMNEQVSLSLYHSLSVPMNESRRANEIVFCFATIEELLKLFRYLLFLVIEYDVFLPLFPFIKETFESYGLISFFTTYEEQEIQAFWFHRLKRRLDVLNRYKVYTSTSKPAAKPSPFALLEAKDNKDEILRLESVIEHSQKDMDKARESSKEMDPSVYARNMLRLQERIDHAKKSLGDYQIPREIPHLTNDPFKQFHTDQKNVAEEILSPPRQQPEPTSLYESVNKRLQMSAEKTSSSLFSRVLRADETSLITHMEEEKKELSDKQKINLMTGPIAQFMSTIAGKVQYRLDMLYKRYPDDVNSFQSHFDCVVPECTEVLVTLDETILEITNNELDLFGMFKRPDLKRFRNQIAILGAVLLQKSVSRTSVYESNFKKTTLAGYSEDIVRMAIIKWQRQE